MIISTWHPHATECMLFKGLCISQVRIHPLSCRPGLVEVAIIESASVCIPRPLTSLSHHGNTAHMLTPTDYLPSLLPFLKTYLSVGLRSTKYLFLQTGRKQSKTSLLYSGMQECR